MSNENSERIRVYREKPAMLIKALQIAMRVNLWRIRVETRD